ncbi:MAG: hypothetical protein MUC69_09050, partial [Gemmatimonadales bacterium]|nr:hypothetical protein [Gemmatimonadales bacterium]
DGLGRRLARLVGSALEPFPQLRVVPVPLALGGDVPSARLFARGEVRRSAAALELGVEVRDANQSLVHAFVVRGDSADPEVLARAVADSLVRRIRPLELQAFRSLAFHRVGDARAITAFLAGDSAFQRDDWVAAEAAFREAVSRDPGFLQAMWGLMIARRFQREEFADELQHLRRHVDSLPPFQRALLAAQEEPDVRLRVERYAALVRSSGGNGQAWLHYTNELFHRGALLGRALDVTLDSMAQLAASHPAMRHASTYDLLIWGNVRLARRREAEREAARRARVAVAGGGFGALHDLALALRFGTVRGWLARRMVLERASPGLLDTLALVGRLGLSLGLPRDQLLIGRLLARRGDTDSTRATGHAAMALAAAAMGRPAEALRQLDSAALASGAPEFTLQRLEWPVLLRVLGLPVDPTRVTSARAGLEALARQQGASAARARFALALDALAVGDSSGAGAHAMALAGDTALVALRLQALLRAHLAGAFGQPELALALSDVVMRLDSATYRSGPLARPATYLARGRWYLQLARPADADAAWRWHENSDLIGWPSAAPQLAEVDAMLAGVAELRRAALAQARGEHRLACARLALPRERWRDVEPAWRPLLAERDSLWREAACRS